MIKVQNSKFTNSEIYFEGTGIVKSNEEGVFEIDNDDLADEVVGAISDFIYYKEPVIENDDNEQHKLQVEKQNKPRRPKVAQIVTEEKPIDPQLPEPGAERVELGDETST